MLKIKNIIIANFGIITVITFVLFFLYGVILDSENNAFLYRELSFFISPYTAGRIITIPLYQLYNLFLLAFSISLTLRVKNIYAKYGSLFLASSSVVGLMLILVPMHPPNQGQTISGLAHISLVGIMSTYIVIALLLFSVAFKHVANLVRLSFYTRIIGLVLLCMSAGMFVFAILNQGEIVGFFEKLPIAIFLFWIILAVIGILKSDRRVKYHFLDTI